MIRASAENSNDVSHLSISQLKSGVILTPHPNRVKKLIFSTKRLIRMTLLSSIVFKKPKLDHQKLKLKLYQIKTGLNIIEVKTSHS